MNCIITIHIHEYKNNKNKTPQIKKFQKKKNSSNAARTTQTPHTGSKQTVSELLFVASVPICSRAPVLLANCTVLFIGRARFFFNCFCQTS